MMFCKINSKEFSNAPVQIEEKTKNSMSLFCKKCNGRRLPKWKKEENKTYWMCETCGDYADGDNNIICKIAK